MTRIYLVSVAVILLWAIVGSAPAFALLQCEVGFTGPNSQNLCESIEKYQCSVKNENAITITNSTNQVVYSGGVTVGGNGSGGSATSGSATNNQGTTFTVVITNGDEPSETPSTCLASVVKPATETPETPEPGRGETPAPVQPTRTVTPVALPVTSGSSTPALLTIFGSGVFLAVASFVYRRLRL